MVDLAVLIGEKLLGLLLAGALLLIPLSFLIPLGWGIEKLAHWLFDKWVDHVLRGSETRTAGIEPGEPQVENVAGLVAGAPLLQLWTTGVWSGWRNGHSLSMVLMWITSSLARLSRRSRCSMNYSINSR